MNVEKINETQIQFMLNKSDLLSRDMCITEIAYGSEKTQQLFRELMEQVVAEYHLNPDNNQLKIVSVPLSVDSITITVSRIDTPPN